MATQPRLPSEHYADAERLLDAADETPASAPLLALAHAVLSTAPRRARLVERHARRAGNGLPQHLTRATNTGKAAIDMRSTRVPANNAW